MKLQDQQKSPTCRNPTELSLLQYVDQDQLSLRPVERKFRLVQVINTWPLAIRKQKVQLFMSKVRQKYCYNFLRYLIIKRCLASTSCAISAKGQQVLGFAYKTVTSQQELTHETLSGLTFAGLAGIIDPPKKVPFKPSKNLKKQVFPSK